jgi:predicted transcriptional regulator
MGKQQPTTTTTNVRMPTEITEALRELAKRHDRSLNGEIVRALREYVERHKDEK